MLDRISSKYSFLRAQYENETDKKRCKIIHRFFHSIHIPSRLRTVLYNPTPIHIQDRSFQMTQTLTAISDPALKTVANTTRYTACLKFNAKKDGSNDYAGARTIAAVFQVGRFDRFVDGTNAKETNAKDLCTGVSYTPFPELQKLSP